MQQATRYQGDLRDKLNAMRATQASADTPKGDQGETVAEKQIPVPDAEKFNSEYKDPTPVANQATFNKPISDVSLQSKAKEKDLDRSKLIVPAGITSTGTERFDGLEPSARVSHKFNVAFSNTTEQLANNLQTFTTEFTAYQYITFTEWQSGEAINAINMVTNYPGDFVPVQNQPVLINTTPPYYDYQEFAGQTTKLPDGDFEFVIIKASTQPTLFSIQVAESKFNYVYSAEPIAASNLLPETPIWSVQPDGGFPGFENSTDPSYTVPNYSFDIRDLIDKGPVSKLLTSYEGYRISKLCLSIINDQNYLNNNTAVMAAYIQDPARNAVMPVEAYSMNLQYEPHYHDKHLFTSDSTMIFEVPVTTTPHFSTVGTQKRFSSPGIIVIQPLQMEPYVSATLSDYFQFVLTVSVEVEGFVTSSLVQAPAAVLLSGSLFFEGLQVQQDNPQSFPYVVMDYDTKGMIAGDLIALVSTSVEYVVDDLVVLTETVPQIAGLNQLKVSLPSLLQVNSDFLNFRVPIFKQVITDNKLFQVQNPQY